MNEYHQQCNKINNKSLEDKLNICDYTDYLQALEFEYVFFYISKIFETESLIYKIQTPLFLYGNNDTLNACAIRAEQCNIILFNKGLMRISINDILENDNLKDFNKSFERTSEYLKIKIEKLIYQFTLLFTFYHEFAHLLQNDKAVLKISEENKNLDCDILASHYKELDADSYSAVHLSRHIIEYCAKNVDPEIVKECIIGLTSIFCSNLVYHLMRFPSADKHLYFEENSHPHSFIRILNIIAIITKYINQDLNLVKRNITITKEEIFEPIVDETLRLQKVYNCKNIDEFRKATVTETKLITTYISKVSKNKPHAINSALDIYNLNLQ